MVNQEEVRFEKSHGKTQQKKISKNVGSRCGNNGNDFC